MAATDNLSEQEQVRRTSLEEIRKLGINPYPAAQYPVNISTAEIHKRFDAEQKEIPDVCVAGRIMSRRIMGNASFGEIMDSSGRIQIYVKRDEVCRKKIRPSIILFLKSFWT